ncbi:hypothetical protein CERZMDRAFT_91688 [Cercospora zeae-maydis SCOH1-5]|uniref:Uncharacterized protein n=1 Tax=Cercospora zeae-maydis SCOH1-5 TaxID=717836 RepID=A0A6A6F0F5_9PEZI|nr:hypothetical protein CERZMDRAFT_91688 [Cercospora zeae-maydis SCOH1-5]
MSATSHIVSGFRQVFVRHNTGTVEAKNLSSLQGFGEEGDMLAIAFNNGREGHVMEGRVGPTFGGTGRYGSS